MGWYMFPWNYDPTWMMDDCQAYSETADSTKQAKPNPMMELMAMLCR